MSAFSAGNPPACVSESDQSSTGHGSWAGQDSCSAAGPSQGPVPSVSAFSDVFGSASVTPPSPAQVRCLARPSKPHKIQVAQSTSHQKAHPKAPCPASALTDVFDSARISTPLPAQATSHFSETPTASRTSPQCVLGRLDMLLHSLDVSADYRAYAFHALRMQKLVSGLFMSLTDIYKLLAFAYKGVCISEPLLGV